MRQEHIDQINTAVAAVAAKEVINHFYFVACGGSQAFMMPRGLIGTLRGDDQQMYFKMLVFDMRQIEQSNLKKEAAKRPKQMQKYSMMMLFCILLIYVVVLSVEVVGSLGSFF